MPTSCRGQGRNELSNELSIPNQGLPVHKFAKLGVTSVALNRNLNLRYLRLKSHNLGVTTGILGDHPFFQRPAVTSFRIWLHAKTRCQEAQLYDPMTSHDDYCEIAMVV